MYTNVYVQEQKVSSSLKIWIKKNHIPIQTNTL